MGVDSKTYASQMRQFALNGQPTLAIKPRHRWHPVRTRPTFRWRMLLSFCEVAGVNLHTFFQRLKPRFDVVPCNSCWRNVPHDAE